MRPEALLLAAALLGGSERIALTQAGESTATLCRQYANTLLRGSADSRMIALQAAKRVAPKERTSELWTAAILELRRITAARRVGDQSPPSEELRAREGPSEYLPRLIEFVAQSEDPIVIDPLLDVMGYHRGAAEALAQFGDQSVDRLIAALSGSQNEPGHPKDIGAMIALTAMLQSPPRVPLSEANRQRIVEATRNEMRGQRDLMRLLGLVRLALATRDPELRARLQSCAAGDPQALAALAPLAGSAAQVSRAIADALVRWDRAHQK